MVSEAVKMGQKMKLGEIGGCAIYRVSYNYKPGYFEIVNQNGETIIRSETPTGIFAAAVQAVCGRG